MLRKEVGSGRVHVKSERASSNRPDLERRGIDQARAALNENREVALHNLLQALEQHAK